MILEGRQSKGNQIVSRIIGSLIAAGLVMIGKPTSVNAADFPYDALTYSKYFWSDNVIFKGDDPIDVEPVVGGRGDIWVSDKWSSGCWLDPAAELTVGVSHRCGTYPVYVGSPSMSINGSTFVSTRVMTSGADQAWFPADTPDILKGLAQSQPQRDPLTGRFLCRSGRPNCDNDWNDWKYNYYDWERIEKVNRGEDSLPDEFWYPRFEALIDPVTNEPVTDPATSQPMLRRVPPDPEVDEPNVVVLDFKDAPEGNPEEVILTPRQRKAGGFLAVFNVSQSSRVKCAKGQQDCFCKYGCFRFEVTSDVAELDTIIYQSEPEADLLLYSWNLSSPSRWDLRGAVWGGRIIDIWTSWLDIAGPTVTYEATYADAIKRMFSH